MRRVGVVKRVLALDATTLARAHNRIDEHDGPPKD